MNEKEETLEARQDPYRLIDEEHNTWQCKVCGYIVSLEAGGEKKMKKYLVLLW